MAHPSVEVLDQLAHFRSISGMAELINTVPEIYQIQWMIRNEPERYVELLEQLVLALGRGKLSLSEQLLNTLKNGILPSFAVQIKSP